ncbi:MAG: cystathionine gamma-synthase family protein [Pseudobdellovibrionaceae bacterium]|nr:MAG: cystathionine gamma-synthase family protein [Pseudobdellovibrionaceae bacterium]
MKKTDESGHEYNPETLALGYGYDPARSEGSVKPPVFLTSTFQFKSSKEGKRFFELAYGLDQNQQNEEMGLIYSRINNPNLQIFEERIAAWDQTEKGAVFASGMAAIATTILSLLKPGDYIISSAPVYGGTHFLFKHILPKFNINTIQVLGGDETPQLMKQAAEKLGPGKVKMLYIETPANPSNALIDIAKVSELASQLGKGQDKVLTVVDNTFLGPVFQRPAHFGADLILYSATKFIGGHSDLVAGVVTGSKSLVDQIMTYRTILGTMANPFTGWLLLRSLETLSVRMRRQAKNSQKLCELLINHPKVAKVYYPSLHEVGSEQHRIYKQQCTGSGSLISFDVKGDENEAFRVLDAFKIARLAVSLGGTESLVEHPMSMTHADVAKEDLIRFGVSPSMIRMSVGLEHISDLKRDLLQALG